MKKKGVFMMKNIFYQLWPIAWVGGKEKAFVKMTKFLDHLEKLGVNYIWLSPVYSSRWEDHGYDVADYFSIDGRFGTEDQFHNFVKEAHRRGMKVLMDIVINHVSIDSELFNPEYCIFRDEPKEGWHNLFDGGPAWTYSPKYGKYYCHLFNEEQADLAWFNEENEINMSLVSYFQKTCDYYMLNYGVDGFRVDAPQAINKDLQSEVFDFSQCLGDGSKNDKSVQVLNAVFGGIDSEMLITEIFDPDNSLSEKYVENSPVYLTMNLMVRDLTLSDIEQFRPPETAIHYLESHDTNRVLSRFEIGVEKELELLLKDVSNICIYQGQEFGVKNPAMDIKEFCKLDAEFRMKYHSGENASMLAPNARANNRVKIDTYMPKNLKSAFIKALKDWK